MLLTTILLFAAWAWLNIKITNFYLLTNSWISKENQTGPVIGDLGGIPVMIPHEFAHFVEYEGDPHFMEQRKGPAPKRTVQSKLRSFGYEVRFPDMLGVTKETWSEKNKAKPADTNWMRVGIDYFGSNPTPTLGLQIKLDEIPTKKWNAVHIPSDPAINWRDKHGYTLSPNLIYGLKVYEVYGYDDTKRDKIPGNDISDENIYFQVDLQGKVDTYIRCSNIRQDFAPCQQYFYLSNAKYTEISVSYRIGFLPQWQEIQAAVTQQILGFAVKSPTIQP